MPPLFHSIRFILDFWHKAELFYVFFSNQCSLINNNSKLPTNLNHFRRLSSVAFSASDIKLFKTLTQTKRMDMTMSVFGCWKFVLRPSMNLQNQFISRLLSQAHIFLIGKRIISFLVIKKAISRILKTTTQCISYQYAAKFLKGFYLIT